LKDKIKKTGLLNMAYQALCTMLFTSIMTGAMITAVEYHNGTGGWWGSLLSTYRSRSFWVGMMMPILIMIVALYASMPYLNNWLRSGRRPLRSVSAWHLNRLLVTVSGLIFSAGTSLPLIIHLVRGDRVFRIDQLLFIFILCSAYIAMIIYLWIYKPDREKVQAFETGDHRKIQDERYQAIVGKSAVSALYRILVILCVAGTLYDLLITKTWPVRTLTEVIGILVIWQFSYNQWSKKL
jgi:hypothetical protein